jgi:hypothetical protein
MLKIAKKTDKLHEDLNAFLHDFSNDQRNDVSNKSCKDTFFHYPYGFQLVRIINN